MTDTPEITGEVLAGRAPEEPRRSLMRCERGTVTILMLLLCTFTYAMLAQPWNTGRAISARIEAQTAADSAAQSGAVWMARSLNSMAATNQASLQASSAHIVGESVYQGGFILAGRLGLKVAWHAKNAAKWTEKALSEAEQAAQWVSKSGALAEVPIIGEAWAAFCLAEAAFHAAKAIQYGEWAVQEVQAFLFCLDVLTKDLPRAKDHSHWSDLSDRLGSLSEHIDKLAAIPEAWQSALESESVETNPIRSQLTAIEDYYDCDIDLQMVRSGSNYEVPYEKNNILGVTGPLGLRLNADSQDKGSWGDDELGGWKHGPTFLVSCDNCFKKKGHDNVPGYLKNPNATATFRLLLIGNLVFEIPKLADRSYQLKGTGGGSPYSAADGLDRYTFIAVARKRTSNEASAQGPSSPLANLAPGVFGDSTEPPTSYSAAEVVNSADGVIHAMGLGFIPYPWILWTDWGWQWQARTTFADPYATKIEEMLSDFNSVSGELVVH